jgi:beta-galactosidase
VPIAHTGFALTISGGRILGVGNGDPNLALSEAPASDGRSAALALFNGLAQVIVCGRCGRRHARTRRPCRHLAPARCAVQVDPPRVATLPAIPPAQSLTEWRQAPASAQRPVPGQKLAEGDMNSWAWTKPGATQPSDPAARWVLLHVSFTPRRAVAAAGGTLRFASLAGRAEIWLDGARIAVKDDTTPARCASFPPGTGERQLDVLFDTLGTLPPALGARFGIAGTVSLTPLR